MSWMHAISLLSMRYLVSTLFSSSHPVFSVSPFLILSYATLMHLFSFCVHFLFCFNAYFISSRLFCSVFIILSHLWLLTHLFWSQYFLLISVFLVSSWCVPLVWPHLCYLVHILYYVFPCLSLSHQVSSVLLSHLVLFCCMSFLSQSYFVSTLLLTLHLIAHFI